MYSFAEQLKKLSAFMRPEHLEDLAVNYAGPPPLAATEIALLVIDVQKSFCDPKDRGQMGSPETEEVSKRIQSLVPEFRKAGVTIYAIHYGDLVKSAADVDFYNFIPDPADTLIAKNSMSAFRTSNIDEILKKDNKKLLLGCGVYLNQCVRETLIDGRHQGFEVCMLEDLTGAYKHASDNDQAIRKMRESGIAMEQSGDVLRLLRERQTAPALTA